MDIVGRAKRIERRIARSLDAAVGEFIGPRTVSPLEIIHIALDRAEAEIQPAGRGQRVFPYTRMVLQVLTGRDRQARARFAAIAEGPPSIEERLRARLESAGCRAPAVTVKVVYVARAGKGWSAPEFDVQFVRDAASESLPAPVTALPVMPTAPPRLKLSVARGTTAQRNYAFSGGRVDIGRRTEVLDAKGRLVRTNHVAFDEGEDEVNASVSRRHAHIEYDAGRREYRLLDDRSAHGTGIVRHGRTIPVPPGSRGVRLESGDEILLGQARVRVALVEGTVAGRAGRS